MRWCLIVALALASLSGACGDGDVSPQTVSVFMVRARLDVGAQATSFTVRVAADVAFELGREPGYVEIASDGTRVDHLLPLVVTPGAALVLEQRLARGRVGTTMTLDIGGERVAVRFADGATTVTLGPLHLDLAMRPDTHVPRVGLALDGTLAASALAAHVTGPMLLKHYSGTRSWFARAGCDDDTACAENGVRYPCVMSCACRCDGAACDCDFAGLEASMERDALAAAQRISPGAPERVRLHWVFKRSLGGSGQCTTHGELDVTPETWGAFFRRATEAAIAINTRVGYRLIDVLSPMNEANHPLQDGAHRNAAGQASLGGFIDFVDLIRQASCGVDGCCAADRFIVADPDVPALLAAALASAHAVVAAADPVFAPTIAVSLYLDTEQRDPLQTDDDGVAPSIVTPVAPFMRSLHQALAGRPFAHELVVVDTYPGSWGAPWFETEDGIVHHLDPSSRHVLRVDPVAAADAAVERAKQARAAIAEVVGAAPQVLLGEVGWSTFDGDEAAQSTFVARLFDALADEPAIDGFIWFKSHDRGTFAFPTWDSAANPLGGPDVACETQLIGPIVCAAALLGQMDGQWGLMRQDGSEKPAWRTFVDRWSRLR